MLESSLQLFVLNRWSLHRCRKAKQERQARTDHIHGAEGRRREQLRILNGKMIREWLVETGVEIDKGVEVALIRILPPPPPRMAFHKSSNLGGLGQFFHSPSMLQTPDTLVVFGTAPSSSASSQEVGPNLMCCPSAVTISIVRICCVKVWKGRGVKIVWTYPIEIHITGTRELAYIGTKPI